MYDTVVALDLETTGTDWQNDQIIEIGAILLENGIETATFSRLIRCDKLLPKFIVNLTGITDQLLATADSPETVYDAFLEFLPPQAICIAHNATFDRSFLVEALGDKFKNKVIDTVELSRICYPAIPSHSLDYLREHLDLPVGKAHRALDDCRSLTALWLKLMQTIEKLPGVLVREMANIIAPFEKHPYAELFQNAANQTLSRDFMDIDSAAAMRDLYKTDNFPPLTRQEKDLDAEIAQVDVKKISQLIGRNGPLAQSLPGYEVRQGQIDMAEAVISAINSGKHLLAEAGTGIGKSLAYLIPAILSARANDEAVVISTNTKNLQAQLFDKDIPFLQQYLNIDFKAALLKGRRNYLCLRKLFAELRTINSELDNDERLRMLNILPWSATTQTGDISENIVNDRPGFSYFWDKLSTIGEECLGRSCQFYNSCFLRRARYKAQEADLVVANHSLVFSDIGKKTPNLPPHRTIIFDEAHNLEEAATRHLSLELSASRLNFSLGRIQRSGRRGRLTGMLPKIIDNIAVALTQPSIAQENKELLEKAHKAAADAQVLYAEIDPVVKLFFTELANLIPGRDRGNRTGESLLRFCAETRPKIKWSAILEYQTALLATVNKFIQGLEVTTKSINLLTETCLDRQKEVCRDLESALQWVREALDDLHFIVTADNAEYVYWIERVSAKDGHIRGQAAPKQVGSILIENLFAKAKSVICTSATLTVGGKFAYMKKRLGLDQLPEENCLTIVAESPFDYPAQGRVYVPMFLPDVGEKGHDYTAELTTFLTSLFRATKGRALVLFTSYEMLTKVAESLQDTLNSDNIRVLAQGINGSRESITAIFKRDIHSVLLGTHSFWEGVDVQGESLSCVVIARLPFAQVNDPVASARCEQIDAAGGNSFMEYTTPLAVLRFRQGFGRLIRHRQDRGIVVVTDCRLITKRYGEIFQRSLPTRVQRINHSQQLLRDVETFLESENRPGNKQC